MKPRPPATRSSNRSHYLIHQFHITAREFWAVRRILNGPENLVKGDSSLTDSVLQYVVDNAEKEDKP